MGVSFFFTLSGFIMTYNYFDWFQKDTKLVGKFLKARIARIFPMSIFVLLLSTPIIIMQFESLRPWLEQHSRFEVTPFSTLLSWLASLLLVHNFFIDGQTGYWVGTTWTLTDELFFYAVFPLFIRYVLSKVKKFKSLLNLAFILVFFQVLFWGATIFYSLHHYDESEFSFFVFHTIYTSPVLRVWEFLLGCLVGWYFLHNFNTVKAGRLRSYLSSPLFRNLALAVTIILILVIIYWPLYGNQNVMGGMIDLMRYYILVAPLFCLILLITSFGPTFIHFLLDRPFFYLLGEASFSLYITQSLSLTLVGYLLPADRTYWGLIGLAGIILNIWFSVFCFKYIETPARLFIRGSNPGKVQEALVK